MFDFIFSIRFENSNLKLDQFTLQIYKITKYKHNVLIIILVKHLLNANIMYFIRFKNSDSQIYSFFCCKSKNHLCSSPLRAQYTNILEIINLVQLLLLLDRT